jgi:hypothetical protein
MMNIVKLTKDQKKKRYGKYMAPDPRLGSHRKRYCINKNTASSDRRLINWLRDYRAMTVKGKKSKKGK